ncbi:MAG: hypothetical protein JXB60_10115 [Candidatus Cloacimonetes bacterium]|nr:hypothetical protein [Candidatus Cloacimonadota bacterium]
MKRSTAVLIFLAIFGLLQAQVLLFHQAPVILDPGVKVDINLEIRQGFPEITAGYIYLREAGSLAYQRELLEIGTETDPRLSCRLNNLRSYPAGLEYYFEVYDQFDNLLATLPEIRPENNPIRLIYETFLTASNEFILLSPDINIQDVEEEFIIAVSFINLKGKLKPGSLKLVMNGGDKSAEAVISSNMIVYRIMDPAPGLYNYHVEATLVTGEKVSSRFWSIEVRGKKPAFPFSYSGLVVTNGKYARTVMREKDETDTDKLADMDINWNGDYKILHYFSRLYITSLETSQAQPSNRYQLGLEIPHLQLTIGDKTPVYSDFTMNGRNIRGIHLQTQFKGFRMLVDFGNLKRSVQGKTCSDTTGTSYTAGTFRRYNLGVRLEFGSPFSFLAGLNFVKNRDKITSLAEKYYLNPEDNLPMVTPKDNLIIGMDTRLSLFQQRLIWGVEAAMSLYNSNTIGGAISQDSLEADFDVNLPFDPEDWEYLFIINKNVEPIIPNLSNLAYKTYIRAIFYRNLLNISYSATGASFNSLSAGYVPKDARIFSLIDNVILMQGKVNLSFGFNYISDNVYDEKDTTSKNTSLFLNLLYSPPGSPYFSLGLTTNNVMNNYDEEYDSSRPLDVKSGSISFNVGHEFTNFRTGPLNLSLNYGNQYNRDVENESFTYRRNNLTLALKNKLNSLPLQTTLSYSITLNDDEIRVYTDSLDAWSEKTGSKSNYHSVYLKTEFFLREDNLKPYLDFRYSSYGGDIESQSHQLINLGVKYSITPAINLWGEGGMKLYSNHDNEDTDYTRYSFRIRASYRF